jgi:DNA-directed RNA polymerase specialized sigma24 family protein
VGVTLSQVISVAKDAALLTRAAVANYVLVPLTALALLMVFHAHPMERRAALLQAVGQLRENLRIIVFHRDLKGLTSAETAKLLGLTVSTVKARTFRARKFLRKHLERKPVGAGLLASQQKRKA